MKYYEVEINWNKDYGALFDYHIYIYIEREITKSQEITKR